MANADLDYIKSELSLTTITYAKWRQQGFTPGHWKNAFDRIDSLRTVDPTPDPTPTPTPTGFTYPFPDSPHYKKIPASPPIHPDSALIIDSGTFHSTSYKWLGPRNRTLYFRGDAYGSFSKKDVYCNFSGGYVCASSPRFSCPIPDGWAGAMTSANNGGDGAAVIIDEATGDYWEFWRLTSPGQPTYNISCSTSRWNSLVAVYLPGAAKNHVTGSNGVAPGTGASGSDILLGNGLMIPEDFADLSPDSVIPHALRIDWNCGANGSRYPVYVPPARSGDGQQTYGAPMGCRLQFNPSVDVNSLTALDVFSDPYKSALKKILRTAQVYGIVPDDTSGGPGTGGIECAISSSIRAAGHSPNSSYYHPWETSPSNLGDGYSNGLPLSLMGSAYWRLIDWRTWTGALAGN